MIVYEYKQKKVLRLEKKPMKVLRLEKKTMKIFSLQYLNILIPPHSTIEDLFHLAECILSITGKLSPIGRVFSQ